MQLRVMIAVGLSVACGGDDPVTPTPTPAPTDPAPTFTEARDAMSLSCGFGTCHGGGAGGLQLDDLTVVEDLVDVPSTVAAGEVLVIAGDADNSYLVKKLVDETGISGQLMPPPFGGLDQAQIDLIAGWIDAGALAD